MIKNILAAAIVVALGACSSGGSSSDDADPTTGGTTTGDTGDTTTGDTTTGGETTVPVSPTVDGEEPVAGTSSGSYVGSFGGADGVYVIDNDFQLAGLAINADGSAQSLFGDLGAGDTFTGGLTQFIHQESRPPEDGDSFGAVASLANPLEIDVTIVNGQTITSTADSATAVSLVGASGGNLIAPATAASLAGTWAGVHSFCGEDAAGNLIDCQLLTTSLTFSGLDVTGSTVVTDTAGVESAPVLIAGVITEFGDAALIDFTFGDSPGYSGVVFFTPSGDGRVAFVGSNPEDTTGGPATISAVMFQQ